VTIIKRKQEMEIVWRGDDKGRVGGRRGRQNEVIIF
jgi:predicted RNA-binding protein YlqC (UPF0109 family)